MTETTIDGRLTTNTLIDKLAREELVTMVPYESARRLFSQSSSENDAGTKGRIWLNANEAAGSGDYQLSSDNINRYPDFQPENLLNAYSDYCGLPKTQLLATRGADEGIELIIRSFCKAYQDNILICSPTYGMYAISAENHGAGIINVPLVNNELDLAELKTQVGKVKVIFLCSPGNPTGNLLPKQQIIETINLFKESAIVVIDEAYGEFAPEHSCSKFINEYSNVIVLRTLSKAFALAGLRCGFTLANEAIITLLSKVIAPYPISAPVAEIASKALTTQLNEMKNRVQATIITRSKLNQWLAQQSWCKDVFASDANFVLFRCSNAEAKTTIFNLLVSHNILIRDQSKQPQLEHCLRISVGSEAEIDQLTAVLSSFD